MLINWSSTYIDESLRSYYIEPNTPVTTGRQDAEGGCGKAWRHVASAQVSVT